MNRLFQEHTLLLVSWDATTGTRLTVISTDKLQSGYTLCFQYLLETKNEGNTRVLRQTLRGQFEAKQYD